MRGVAGRPVKIRFRVESEDGILTAVDNATTIPVTVKAGDGSTTVASGFATPEAQTGIYSFTLPAQTAMDTFTATATAVVGGSTYTLSERVQLADRRMVPLSVMRTDPVLSGLDTLTFMRVVDDTEDAFISALNFPPVVQGERFEWRSDQCVRLFVPGVYQPQQVYALTCNDVDQLAGNYTPQQVHVRDGAIERGYGYNFGTGFYDPLLGVYAVPWLPGVYKGWIAHGWDHTPADLQKAAVVLARHIAQTTSYPERATRIMSEASEIWFSTPNGSDRPFGIPEVDGAVVRYRMPEPLGMDPGAF